MYLCAINSLIMKRIACVLFFCTGILFAKAQEGSYQVAVVGFYNVENLFDTIDSPDTDDYEFTPEGSGRWNAERYHRKLGQISQVIRQLGDEMVKEGPVIVGLSEVENGTVVDDLVRTHALRGYAAAHHESPDRRGIDVSLIYQPSRFKVFEKKGLRVRHPSDTSWRTRDVLLVSGVLDGDTVHVMVNHWPSRRGGEQTTAPLRAAAATVCRKAADSLFRLDPKARIIIMGDFNDDPGDESLTRYLQARTKPEKTRPGDLYNPMAGLFREGHGSLAYRDAWNLFDQIIVSWSMLDRQNEGYRFYKARIFNPKYLVQKQGQYAGYPFRTYGGGVYQGGYSDHFPVYIFLIREKK